MMKLVYTNENSFSVSNAKNLIEAEGIGTFLKNEFAQGAVGETSAFDAWPEVWIFRDSDYERALSTLSKHHLAAKTLLSGYVRIVQKRTTLLLKYVGIANTVRVKKYALIAENYIFCSSCIRRLHLVLYTFNEVCFTKWRGSECCYKDSNKGL
ncbi:DUF2007 domain-containing protein [Neptunomonas qingdaonensis]|uniref:Putative signal transducing protein n=1 Tax=Neptunomonas qingdaonensis TaxID=1045558 RepID=A0A1I2LZ04_9GAMM|nr:DUF2007 domain-containing protein [Neptunomonas qingdaonensis]SFF82366.1 Putative signal transducing protein [Neptunomonas qingdaonensis]